MSEPCSREQAYQNCLDYFGGDEMAADAFINKYLLKNKDQELMESSVEERYDAIADEFDRIEQGYNHKYKKDDILPAIKPLEGPIVLHGSPVYGIANPYQYVSLSNCFILEGPYDSYGGILRADTNIAHVSQRRGGCGLSLNSLRPAGTSVQNSARFSDGVISFVNRFTNTAAEVGQAGRRSALIQLLDCRHPDIEAFIEAKGRSDLKDVNLSVQWTDDFLKAVENNETYILRYPIEASPEEAEITKEVNAREIFHKSSYYAWDYGCPGCMFWDTVTGKSISDVYVSSVACNPCGELPGHRNSVCSLISDNLYWFIKNPFSAQAEFDWESFKYYLHMKAYLLDDLIDLEIERIQQIIDKINSDPEPDNIKYPERELWEDILKSVERYRKVGGGHTGIADMLAALNMSYGSEESAKFLDKVFKFDHDIMYSSSADLACERGPFIDWDWYKEKDNHYISILSKTTQDKVKNCGRRNLTSQTMAPVGTMSLVHRVSSGGEPVYNLHYYRWRKLTSDEDNPDYIDNHNTKWKKIPVDHPPLKKWKEVTGQKDIENSPYYGCMAHDLNWKDRIRVQSVIQDSCDNSVSSTLNLPQDTTVEDVQDIYLYAWKSGLKGVTIFRKGCRKEGILTGESDDNKTCQEDVIESCAPKRPKDVPCDIHVSNIKDKSSEEVNKWILLVGLTESGKPRELFGGYRHDIEIPGKYDKGYIRKVKKNHYDLLLNGEGDDWWTAIEDIGNTVEPQHGSQTRQISLMLRFGIPLADISKQLLKDSDVDLFTFEKGIARVLKKYITDGEYARSHCPECGEGSLIFAEGCVKCDSCGWSGCS